MSTAGSSGRRRRATRCSCFRHARHPRSRCLGRTRRFLGSLSCKASASRSSYMHGRLSRCLQIISCFCGRLLSSANKMFHSVSVLRSAIGNSNICSFNLFFHFRFRHLHKTMCLNCLASSSDIPVCFCHLFPSPVFVP